MSKSKETTEVTVITDEPNIHTGVDITKDDIIAVGVVEAEDYMQGELKSAQEAAAAAFKKSQELSTELTETLHKFGQAFTDEIAVELTAGLQCLNPRKLTFSCNVSTIYEPAESRKKPYVWVTVTCSEARGENNESGLQLTRGFKQYVPKEYIELRDAVNEQQSIGEAKNKEALEWKRRLSRIPQYERILRSELAKSRLEKTQTGKDILHAMLGDVKKRCLALPGS